MSVESPCIRNCCLDEQDVCLGCRRTLQEICAWGTVDDNGKREILANAQRRTEEERERRSLPPP